MYLCIAFASMSANVQCILCDHVMQEEASFLQPNESFQLEYFNPSHWGLNQKFNVLLVLLFGFGFCFARRSRRQRRRRRIECFWKCMQFFLTSCLQCVWELLLLQTILTYSNFLSIALFHLISERWLIAFFLPYITLYVIIC